MTDGFIVRKGGVAVERTTAPSINFVSKTSFNVVLNFTNNENNQVDLFYSQGTTPPATKITLAAGATSTNITFGSLAPLTTYTFFAFSYATEILLKKIKSEIVSTIITTDENPFIEAIGGTILEYNLSGKRYRSHTFTSSGTFEITKLGIGDVNSLDYLIIGGGGSGAGFSGGGGGAGGYITSSAPTPGNETPSPKVVPELNSYPIIVGGTNGNSIVFGLTAQRGGGGAGFGGVGGNGGSGGGGGGCYNFRCQPSGGLGFAGPPRQGFNGGRGPLDGDQYGTGQGGNGGGVNLASNIRAGFNETRGQGGSAANQTGRNGSGSFVCIRYEILPL